MPNEVGHPLPVLHARETPFSYDCHGCGRCCHHKAIRVGPYEVARLADALGESTTVVLARYVAEDGATLETVESGACVFLDGGRCTVHHGRPLVCRLYPLGWGVGPSGAEAFVELQPHPQTEGVYGEAGSVADYLEAQGTEPYQRAAARYAAVFRRILAAAEREGPEPEPHPPLADVDAAVAAACEARGIFVPDHVETRVALHLEELHRWLDTVEATESQAG